VSSARIVNKHAYDANIGTVHADRCIYFKNTLVVVKWSEQSFTKNYLSVQGTWGILGDTVQGLMTIQLLMLMIIIRSIFETWCI